MSEQKEIKNIKVSELDCGLPVITQMMPNYKGFGMIIRVNAGSEHDAREGFSHFAEHCFFCGTEKRTYEDFKRIHKGNGDLDIGADTGLDSMFFRSSSVSGDYKAVIDLLTDQVLNANFPEANILCEKYNAGQEDQKGFDALSRKICSVGLNKEDFSNNKDGLAKELNIATRSDLLKFKKEFFYPGNMVISIVHGDNLSHEEILENIKEPFAKFIKKEPAKDLDNIPKYTGGFGSINNENQKKSMMFAFNCTSQVMSTFEGKENVKILNRILSDRLYKTEQNNSGINISPLLTRGNTGFFIFRSATNEPQESIDKATEEFIAVSGLSDNNKITEEEINEAMHQLSSEDNIDRENIEEICRNNANEFAIYGKINTSEYIPSVADLERTAKIIFSSKPSLAIEENNASEITPNIFNKLNKRLEVIRKADKLEQTKEKEITLHKPINIEPLLINRKVTGK